MNQKYFASLLNDYKMGNITEADALARLKNLPFETLGFASVDHHREMRQGFPEVIFCEGKTPDQVVAIAKKIIEKECTLLATRASADLFKALKKKIPKAHYHPSARVITANEPPAAEQNNRLILVVTAGTADIPVADEAVITAKMMRQSVDTLFDVGVAGIHRLLVQSDKLKKASAIIVVAGMDGALPSVVGGLVRVPVIAVPTSTGYGASFHGLAALLSVLNSCSAGVTVVNIDNGFGAGFAASLITRNNS